MSKTSGVERQSNTNLTVKQKLARGVTKCNIRGESRAEKGRELIGKACEHQNKRGRDKNRCCESIECMNIIVSYTLR